MKTKNTFVKAICAIMGQIRRLCWNKEIVIPIPNTPESGYLRFKIKDLAHAQETLEAIQNSRKMNPVKRIYARNLWSDKEIATWKRADSGAFISVPAGSI